MKNTFIIILLFLTLVGKAQTIVPIMESDGKFSISCANIYFQIDSADGARISSLQLDGNELLYVAGFGTTDMAGSTFWPSPQSVWGWPPPENLDNQPYTSTISGNQIKFKGSTDTGTTLRFYKTMYANGADTSIVIEYNIKNEKASAQSWAPWEITRVVGQGLTVFAKGDGSVTGDMTSRTEALSGYVWYDQDNTADGDGSKFFCDGKGWLAHVIDGNKLFIKKFEDIEKAVAASDEAEIEVYTATGNTYTELENQGAYAAIAAKDSVTWKVKWFARNLPTSVDVSVGSSSLTDYIEGVINRSTDGVSVPDVRVNCRVKVYPNPAVEFMVIQSDLDSYNGISLWVYNLQGKVMMNQVIDQPQQQVSVKNLLNGVYLYELKQHSISLGKGHFSIEK